MSERPENSQEPDRLPDGSERKPGIDQDRDSDRDSRRLRPDAALFEQLLRRAQPRTARIDVQRILSLNESGSASGVQPLGSAGATASGPAAQEATGLNRESEFNQADRSDNNAWESAIFDPADPPATEPIRQLLSGSESNRNRESVKGAIPWRTIGGAWVGGMVMGGCLMFFLLDRGGRTNQFDASPEPAAAVAGSGPFLAEPLADPAPASRSSGGLASAATGPTNSVADGGLSKPLSSGILRLKKALEGASWPDNDFDFLSGSYANRQPARSDSEPGSTEESSTLEFPLQIQLLPDSGKLSIQYLTEKLSKEIL